VPPALVARAGVNIGGFAGIDASQHLASRASAGIRWISESSSSSAESDDIEDAMSRYAGECSLSSLRRGGITTPGEKNTCKAFGGRGSIVGFSGAAETGMKAGLQHLASMSGPGGGVASSGAAQELARFSMNGTLPRDATVAGTISRDEWTVAQRSLSSMAYFHGPPAAALLPVVVAEVPPAVTTTSTGEQVPSVSSPLVVPRSIHWLLLLDAVPPAGIETPSESYRPFEGLTSTGAAMRAQAWRWAVAASKRWHWQVGDRSHGGYSGASPVIRAGQGFARGGAWPYPWLPSFVVLMDALAFALVPLLAFGSALKIREMMSEAMECLPHWCRCQVCGCCRDTSTPRDSPRERGETGGAGDGTGVAAGTERCSVCPGFPAFVCEDICCCCC